jgi:hypothetical protein
MGGSESGLVGLLFALKIWDGGWHLEMGWHTLYNKGERGLDSILCSG